MRLFDSNVVIELVRRADAALQRRVLTGGFAVSVVTRIEALGFHRFREEEERELLAFFRAGSELALNDAVAARAIALRQQRRMGLGDAIIAATALENDLPLATRNTADFKHVTGLRLIDPFETE